MTLIIKPKRGCRWDLVSLGEGMLRFDPGEYRIVGGIFCAFSEATPELALEAMQVAHKFAVVGSYDLNYRVSLWKLFGGKKRAQEVNRRIASYVVVRLGNEEAFSTALGYNLHDREGFRQMMQPVLNDARNRTAA
jgi:sugar/nucleoside kinase (ribokinase family)